MSRVDFEDFDPTISALRGGVENLAIERCSRRSKGGSRLEESGDSQLAPIAENLRQLRALLTADTLDGTAIGLLLGVLGEQVHGVASGSLGGECRWQAAAIEWAARYRGAHRVRSELTAEHRKVRPRARYIILYYQTMLAA